MLGDGNMKGKIRKTISIILAIIMVMTYMPATTFALTNDPGTNNSYSPLIEDETECRMLYSSVPIDMNDIDPSLLNYRIVLSGKQTSADIYLYLVREKDFKYDYSTLEPINTQGFDINYTISNNSIDGYKYEDGTGISFKRISGNHYSLIVNNDAQANYSKGTGVYNVWPRIYDKGTRNNFVVETHYNESSSHIHSTVKTVYKSPTCTDWGNNEYYTCNECGKIFKDKEGSIETTISAERIHPLGHSLTKIDEKKPTSTQNGNVAYWICDNESGVYYKDYEGLEKFKSFDDVIIPAVSNEGIVANKTNLQLEPNQVEKVEISLGEYVESLSYRITYDDGTEIYDDEITVSFEEKDDNKIDVTVTADTYCGNYIVRLYNSYDLSEYIDIKVKVYELVRSVYLSSYEYVYDGKVHKPSVTVYDSEYKKVNKSKYSVKYDRGCKSVGTYTVTVIPKNGSFHYLYEFTIKPKGTKITSVKANNQSIDVKWKKQSKQTSGYIIEYSTYKDFRSYKTKTISGTSKTHAKISSLGYGKKYYVRVRTYKKYGIYKYYSNVSSIKSVTVPALSQAKAKSKITAPLYRNIKKNVSDPSKVRIVKAWVGKSDSSVFTNGARVNVIVFKYTYNDWTYYAIGSLDRNTGKFICKTNWGGNEYYLTNRSTYSISAYL